MTDAAKARSDNTRVHSILKTSVYSLNSGHVLIGSVPVSKAVGTTCVHKSQRELTWIVNVGTFKVYNESSHCGISILLAFSNLL